MMDGQAGSGSTLGGCALLVCFGSWVDCANVLFSILENLCMRASRVELFAGPDEAEDSMVDRLDMSNGGELALLRLALGAESVMRPDGKPHSSS